MTFVSSWRRPVCREYHIAEEDAPSSSRNGYAVVAGMTAEILAGSGATLCYDIRKASGAFLCIDRVSP
jgi:hypothetical protein